MHVWVAREEEADIHLHGRYVYWSYFLTGEFIPWDRTTGQIDRVKVRRPLFCRRDAETCPGWGAWQVAVRWSEADFIDEDIAGGMGEAWTFALNWHWNDAAKMQLNYVTGRIDNNEVSAVNGIDSGSYDIVGTRFMIDY
jgi:phosphate-selective porin OprO/OprP